MPRDCFAADLHPNLVFTVVSISSLVIVWEFTVGDLQAYVWLLPHAEKRQCGECGNHLSLSGCLHW